jgi:hypothetical protein
LIVLPMGTTSSIGYVSLFMNFFLDWILRHDVNDYEFVPLKITLP